MKMDYGKPACAAMLLAMAILGSCSGNREPVGDAPSIAFSANGNQSASRAAITTGLRKIGVFGYSHTDNFNVDTDLLVPDFFVNQGVADIAGNGVWTYSGVRKYWPQDGRYVSFFAYAPFLDVEDTFVVTPSAATDPGSPAIDYTVPARIIDQIDLVYGNRVDMTYGTSDHGVVDLAMDHALTLVDFVVRLDRAEVNRPFKVRFNELTVRNVAGSGTLDLSRSISDPALWTSVRPDDAAGWASYTMTPGGHGGLAGLVFDARAAAPAEGQTDPWSWNRLCIAGQYLMLIPQALGDTIDDLTPAEISLKYTVTNVYSGEVADVEEVLPLWRTMLPAWQAGAAVTYQLTLSLMEGTAIEFEIGGFIEATPWDDRNSGNPIGGTVG